jgi:hypothetical protein
VVRAACLHQRSGGSLAGFEFLTMSASYRSLPIPCGLKVAFGGRLTMEERRANDGHDEDQEADDPERR